VRGISGGQRKRLTTGEMVVGSVLVLHCTGVLSSCQILGLQKPDCHLLCCRPKTTLLCGEHSGQACTAATFACHAQLVCRMLAICNIAFEQLAFVCR
jgi:hypothetical protein